MLIYISLNRFSYFKPFRAYFILIYSGFLPFLAKEAIQFLAPDNLVLLRFTAELMVTSALMIAVVWGHLCTRLFLYPGKFTIREVLSPSRDRAHLLYQIYLIPMVVLFVLVWVPFRSLIPGIDDPIIFVQAFYPLELKTMPAVGFALWFLAESSTVVFAFIAYPNYVLVRLRSQLRDREVRFALRTFAVGFGMISALLLGINALADIGTSVVGLGNMVDVLLLSFVVHEFGKPSFLKAFLGVVPSFVSTGRVKDDQTIVLYATDGEKYGPFSRFLIEGINKKQQVVCFYHGNETTFSEELNKNNVNVSTQVLKGNLRLLPIQSLYPQAGYFDDKQVLRIVNELEEEARSQERNGLRLLVDYGDFVRRPMMKFTEHLKDGEWTRPDHFVNVLMGFNKQALDSAEALETLKAGVQVLDLSEAPEVFSRTLGLSHNQMTGKKILIEYDLLSDVDKMLKAIAAESASNLERTVVFARSDSPARSLEGNEPGLKMFLLTTRVSKPSYEKENLVLLPTYDSSLILDSMEKTIESYSAAPFTVLFDNISHLVFTLGKDRAYSLVRQALELMASDNVTAVFLLNMKAHEPKTVSMFESLFDIEIVSRPGARIPEIRTSVGAKQLTRNLG